MTSDWLVMTLFWTGAVLFLLGLSLVIAPVRMMKLASLMDRRVSTDRFFDRINTPHYQESLIYQHHGIAGGLIFLLAAVSFYMLAFFAGTEVVIQGISSFATSEFSEWLMVNLYYILLAFNLLALLVGAVVGLRPSLLKRIETWGNRWIETEAKLDGLNRTHEIPENLLTGKPRWFGLFILLGSLYMMFMLGRVIF